MNISYDYEQLLYDNFEPKEEFEIAVVREVIQEMEYMNRIIK